MKRYGILVRDEFKLSLWTRFLKAVGNCAGDEIESLVLSLGSDRDDGREAFSECSRWLTGLLDARDAGRLSGAVVVLTDLSGSAMATPFDLDPCSRTDACRRILGMLILSFPEVHWAIEGAISLCPTKGFWRDAHLLPLTIEESNDPLLAGEMVKTAIGLSAMGYSPLFDGSGLRNIVRRAMRKHSGKQDIPTREWCSLALDDEVNYALMHAYAAYRFGMKAIPVHTFTLARRLLGKGGETLRKRDLDLQVVFEDVFLALPDGLDGLSDLSRLRHQQFPGLEDPPHRLLVTLGMRQPDEPEKWERNRVYIAQQRSAGKNVGFVAKPHAGIFGFWDRSTLRRRLHWNFLGRPRNGIGKGFAWPPNRKSEPSTQGAHSAPGVIELVAHYLVERAQRKFSDTRTIEDAIIGAVLATDALELLGGKVPTTSLDALMLKHQFEVSAECHFSGAQYDLELQPRLAEVMRDVGNLCAGFRRESRTKAALSAEIKILNGLLLLFRANAQFEGEQACMNRIRHLRGSLWMEQGPSRRVFWPVIRYVEILLSSFPKFLCAICLWLVVLSLLYTWTGADHSWTLGFEDGLTSFFSNGAPFHEAGVSDKPPTTAYVAVVCLAIAAGFAHLGIFISHVYSLITRK